MLEAAEIGSSLSREDYKKREPELRWELVQLQHRFKASKSSMIIVVEGDDRPGCDDVMNVLNAWMDPRFIETQAFGLPTDEERERPLFWRYWRALPARGRIAIFSTEWTLWTIAARMRGNIDEREMEHRTDQIRRFEKALADDGTVLVKFWLHISKRELKKRLKAGEKNPEELWRYRQEDKTIYKKYASGMAVVETILGKTSTAEAPWIAVESTCRRHRDITVAEAIRSVLRRCLDGDDAAAEKNAGGAKQVGATKRPETARRAAAPERQHDAHTVLDTVDLKLKIDDKRYEKQIVREQARLHRLALKAARKERSAVLLFEGWDAAGKGGAIRRLTAALNAQMYRIVPIAAPTEEERAHHYLWRFWRHVPRLGRIAIFDRSWYGRVLVERVEGFAAREEWQRAYAEINDFEEQLTDDRIVLCKFWLHIDKAEQLRRFKERRSTSYKRFKITEEDFRNRKKWNAYEVAANEMVARTSTPHAPWHLIAANDKNHARVEIVRIVADSLKEAL